MVAATSGAAVAIGIRPKFQENISGAFDNVELVQPGGMTYRAGIYSFTAARRLTGPNAIFRQRPLVSTIPLEVDGLYLVDDGPTITEALELVPFFKLLEAPQTEQTAVYFYNSTLRDGSFRFVSYHFEAEPDRPVQDLPASADEAATDAAGRGAYYAAINAAASPLDGTIRPLDRYCSKVDPKQ